MWLAKVSTSRLLLRCNYTFYKLRRGFSYFYTKWWGVQNSGQMTCLALKKSRGMLDLVIFIIIICLLLTAFDRESLSVPFKLMTSRRRSHLDQVDKACITLSQTHPTKKSFKVAKIHENAYFYMFQHVSGLFRETCFFICWYLPVSLSAHQSSS